MIIVAHLASAIPKDENKDCGDEQHFDGGFDSVIEGDNDKGFLTCGQTRRSATRRRGRGLRRSEQKEDGEDPHRLQRGVKVIKLQLVFVKLCPLLISITLCHLQRIKARKVQKPELS